MMPSRIARANGRTLVRPTSSTITNVRITVKLCVQGAGERLHDAVVDDARIARRLASPDSVARGQRRRLSRAQKSRWPSGRRMNVDCNSRSKMRPRMEKSPRTANALCSSPAMAVVPKLHSSGTGRNAHHRYSRMKADAGATARTASRPMSVGINGEPGPGLGTWIEPKS